MKFPERRFEEDFQESLLTVGSGAVAQRLHSAIRADARKRSTGILGKRAAIVKVKVIRNYDLGEYPK